MIYNFKVVQELCRSCVTVTVVYLDCGLQSEGDWLVAELLLHGNVAVGTQDIPAWQHRQLAALDVLNGGLPLVQTNGPSLKCDPLT